MEVLQMADDVLLPLVTVEGHHDLTNLAVLSLRDVAVSGEGPAKKVLERFEEA